MSDVRNYINKFPPLQRSRLKKVRSLIKKSVKDGDEMISWGMIGIKQNGRNVLNFGGFKNHIGIYPGPKVINELKSQLSSFKTTKGAIQIPYDSPLPEKLIIKIVKTRLIYM